MKDRLNYSELVETCRGGRKLTLTRRQRDAVGESRRVFEEILRADPQKPYYGINTGVGALLNRRVPDSSMREFQENLIMSHCSGVGPAVEREITKGMMLHMILNLKKDCSLIRLPTLELLVEMFNRDIIPVVPRKGSLGASGDLAPQAHIALALIGRGEVCRGHGENPLPACSVLNELGLQPAGLEKGEAIALLNGTSLMTSYLAFIV